MFVAQARAMWKARTPCGAPYENSRLFHWLGCTNTGPWGLGFILIKLFFSLVSFDTITPSFRYGDFWLFATILGPGAKCSS